MLRGQGTPDGTVGMGDPASSSASTRDFTMTPEDDLRWATKYPKIPPPASCTETVSPIERRNQIKAMRSAGTWLPGQKFVDNLVSERIAAAEAAVHNWLNAKDKRMALLSSSNPASSPTSGRSPPGARAQKLAQQLNKERTRKDVDLRSAEEEAWSRVQQTCKILTLQDREQKDFAEGTIGHLIFASYGTLQARHTDVTSICKRHLQRGRFQNGIEANATWLDLLPHQYPKPSDYGPEERLCLRVFYIGRAPVYMDSFKDGFFKASMFVVDSRRDSQGSTASPVSELSPTSPQAGSRRNSVPANATHPLFAFVENGSRRGSEASAGSMTKTSDGAGQGRRTSKSCPGKEWNFDRGGRLSEPTPGAEWDF